MAKPYGFLKCRVVSTPELLGARTKHEIQYHLHAKLSARTPAGEESWAAAINVGTTDADDPIRYRIALDFRHVMLADLRARHQGFRKLTGVMGLPALDYLRSDVLLRTGKWRDSDVIDDADSREPHRTLARLFERARVRGADLYVFGRRSEGPGLSMHDVHMNQGSSGFFLNHGNDGNDHNDCWQDGAVLIDFGEPEWTAYFASFTKQTVPTDDRGNPEVGGHPVSDADPGSLRP